MLVLTQVPDPEQVGVDWFNLDNPGNVVLLVGFLIPVLTGLVTKTVASSGLKAVVTLTLSAIAATIGTLVGSDGGFALQDFVNSFLSVYLPAIVTYYGLYKPSGLAGSVQAATSGFGLGPKPVMQTDDVGAESAGNVRPLAGERGWWPDDKDRGSTTVDVILLGLGFLLVILAVFAGLPQWLLWLGGTLIVVGAVLMAAGPRRRL